MVKNHNILVSIIVGLLFFLTGCSSFNESHHYAQNVYRVKVTSIKCDSDGNFVIEGKTDAPESADILAPYLSISLKKT